MNYYLSNIQYVTKPSLLQSHSRTLNFSFLISFNTVGSNPQSLTLHSNPFSKNPQNYCLSNIDGNLVILKFKNVWWLWDIYRLSSKYYSSSYMVCKIDLHLPIWSHLWSLGLHFPLFPVSVQSQAPHKPSIFTTQGLCSCCTLPWLTRADRSFRA